MKQSSVKSVVLVLVTLNLVSAKDLDLDTRIKDHLDVVDNLIKTIDWYFKEGFTDTDAYLQEDIEEYISNPINVFVMIKRGALYWPKLKSKLTNQTMLQEWDQLMLDIQKSANIPENQILQES